MSNKKPKGPGKNYRKGLNIYQVMDELFATEDKARLWLESIRWKKGIFCAHCGSTRIAETPKHPYMPYRCKDCRKHFSVKVNTVMHRSPLAYRMWAMAIYFIDTQLKSNSAMKFYRDLGVCQKTAWFLAHRLRAAWNYDETVVFEGPVEVDEATTDGIVSNMSNKKRAEWRKKFGDGRGMTGKTVIIAMFDRDSKQTIAKVMEKHDKDAIQEFVLKHTEPGCIVMTDGSNDYKGLPDRRHEAVSHNKKKYAEQRMINGKLETVSTNNVETFWSMLKRGHQGVFHKISPKQLQRYVDEAVGKRNVRSMDTIKQMESIAKGMFKTTLPYKELIKDNGFYSAARGCDPKVDKRLL